MQLISIPGVVCVNVLHDSFYRWTNARATRKYTHLVPYKDDIEKEFKLNLLSNSLSKLNDLT